MTVLAARCGFDLFVDLNATLGTIYAASSEPGDVFATFQGQGFKGLPASTLIDVEFDVLGDGFATPALNDPAGPIFFDAGLDLSTRGSVVFPLEFDNGVSALGDDGPSAGGGDGGGGGGTPPATPDGFAVLLGSVETEGAGAWQSGAVPLEDTMPVAEAIDDLNAIMGLLVPAQPPAFPNGSLTVASVGLTPLLCSGVTVNASGSGLSAGNAVTRITGSTVSSNTLSAVGPGKSGDITLLVNGSADGSHTLTGTGDAGTYGGLLIANQHDFPTSTPGFWKSIDVSVSNAAVPVGINSIEITDTAASNTNTVYFVRDGQTSLSAISSPSLVQAGAGTEAFSSGVPHYNTGATLTAGLTFSNVSGETYYGGTDPLTITGTNGVIAAQTYSYTNLGVSTPIARQTTTETASGLTVNVNPSNLHGSGTIQGSVKNPNGASAAANITSQIVLVKNGSAGAKIDENSITVSGLGSGSNAVRLSGGSNADTPSGTPGSWTSSSTIQTYDATVVGGVLSHDATNYSTGYLPAGPDLSSGRSGAQYVTFAFDRASLSQFKINVTGTYAGCWIKLPGVSDQSGISPNAPNGWWNAEAAYVGAGVPGGGADTIAGCASGAVMNGGSGTFTMTFGTQSSSNATANQILVRFKLNAGQSITALSFSN